jgi:hypothetical protein
MQNNDIKLFVICNEHRYSPKQFVEALLEGDIPDGSPYVVEALSGLELTQHCESCAQETDQQQIGRGSGVISSPLPQKTIYQCRVCGSELTHVDDAEDKIE